MKNILVLSFVLWVAQASIAQDSVKTVPALNKNNAVATQMLESGKSMATIGHVMAGGGLVLGLIGEFSKSSPLVLIGGVSNAVGIPLLGVGAGRINNAAEILNPNYKADYRGWGWYWTGFALDIFADIVKLNAINMYNDATDQAGRDDAVSAMTSGIVIGLVGSVFGITSWVKFGNLAGEGKRAAAGEVESMNWNLVPEFQYAANGKSKSGMVFVYRF